MNASAAEQMTIFDLDTWCGKTSQAPFPQTKEKISKPSSRKSSGSSSRTLPMCLYLTKGDGTRQDASTIQWASGALLGEYTTRSFGEYPREENASRLSQILEDCPHPKYYLSARACQGILNRANRRGKELPKELADALTAQATPSKFGGGVETDSAGKRAGKGALVQKEKSGTIGVSQDQTLIVLEGNGSRPSHKGDGYSVSETMYTLNAVEQHAVCAEAKAIDVYNQTISGDVAPTVTAAVGGGNTSGAKVLECTRLGNCPDAYGGILQTSGNDTRRIGDSAVKERK